MEIAAEGAEGVAGEGPSAWDEDVQYELRRGRAAAAALPARLWAVLNEIVSDPGETEAVLRTSGRNLDLLGPWRMRRAVAGLVSLGYVRREDDRLFPTVAGIGVVRPFMSLSPSSSQFPALREMRRAETAQGADV